LRDKSSINIPDWWGGKNIDSNRCKTRSEVIAKRKRDNKPDISYDLDGDGCVGGRDYLISKRFDNDGDGKLDAEERKAAEEAIRNVRIRF